MNIYPKDESAVAPTRLVKEAVATAIIAQMKLGNTKAQSIGPVLNSSDDIATFNEVWAALEAEGKSMRALSPNDFTDKASYKTALGDLLTYASEDDFYIGIKIEKGATNFTELKESYKTH